MARALLLPPLPGSAGARRTLLAALCLLPLLLLVGWVLAPTLDAGWVYDDRADVLDNPAATPAGFLPSLGRTNRPLVKASYALQRAATGSDPRPFHAANLALHLLTTLAVCALARRVARGSGAARPELAGVLAAALWALHPAAVEAVGPVSGRSLLLSAPLLLAALLLVTGEEPPGRTAAAGALLLAFAAPLARETALVLPALGLAWQATLGASEARATAMRRQLPLLAGTALAAGALALSARHRELLEFSFATRSPLEALRGNLFAVFEILRLAVAPARISIDPASPADQPWLAPATLLRLLALAGAVGLALAARRRKPLLSLAIGWTLVALAPTNSVVWRLDPVSARPLYLASIVPIAVGVACAARATAERRLASAATAAALLWVCSALANHAHLRALLYRDPIALWTDAAEKAPDRARPWNNLGIELMLVDDLDPAERALERALAIDPTKSGARCALDALRIRRRGFEMFERRSFP